MVFEIYADRSVAFWRVLDGSHGTEKLEHSCLSCSTLVATLLLSAPSNLALTSPRCLVPPPSPAPHLSASRENRKHYPSFSCSSRYRAKPETLTTILVVASASPGPIATASLGLSFSRQYPCPPRSVSLNFRAKTLSPFPGAPFLASQKS